MGTTQGLGDGDSDGATGVRVGAAFAPENVQLELSPIESQVFASINEGLEARALPTPEAADPLLSLAARKLGEFEGKGGVGIAEVRASMEIVGAYDTFVHHEVIPITDAASELPPSEELIGDFLDISAERTANVVGLAWVPNVAGGGNLVLMSSFRVVALEPIPRQVGPSVRVRGDLMEKSAEVQLVVNTGETATSTRLPVTVRSDGKFSVEVPVPEGVTTMEAELVGVGPSWGRSFATLRFHAGSPPTTIEDAARGKVTVANAAAAEKLLMDQVNRHRSLLGLTAFRNDPGLRALAALDANTYALGQSPESSDEGPMERLQRWGAFTKEARLVLASGDDLKRLIELVWYDPTRRKRLLDPESTDTGLAVIEAPKAASRRFTLVAYVTQPRFPHSAAADLADVVDALNARRAEAGKPALELDAQLADVANRHAYPLLSTPKVPPTIGETVVTDLRTSSVKFEFVVVDIQAATNPADMKFARNLVGEDWKHLGVAVARGLFGGSKSDVVVAVLIGTR